MLMTTILKFDKEIYKKNYTTILNDFKSATLKL